MKEPESSRLMPRQVCGQVVRAEAEELGGLGDLVGGRGRRAGFRSWCRPGSLIFTFFSALTSLATRWTTFDLEIEFLLEADERDHDLRASTLTPAFWTSAAASKMARACISVISG